MALGKTVGQLMREMPYTEFLEWMAYAKVEPFGETRMDHRFAHVMAYYANSHRDSKEHPEPFKISDFILQYADEEKDSDSDGDGESGDGSGDWKPKISKEQQLNNLRLWKTFF